MNRPNERVEFVHDFLAGIFANDLHAERVASLANGTLGVMTSASLAASIIGTPELRRAVCSGNMPSSKLTGC